MTQTILRMQRKSSLLGFRQRRLCSSALRSTSPGDKLPCPTAHQRDSEDMRIKQDSTGQANRKHLTAVDPLPKRRCLAHSVGFPGGASGKEPTCQYMRHKRHGFDPWVETQVKMRLWVWPLIQHDPLEEEMATYSSIFAWKFHGQRSLVGYSP